MKMTIDNRRKNKTKIVEDKKVKNPEFDIKIGDLDKKEINMCACKASDDNPYQT